MYVLIIKKKKNHHSLCDLFLTTLNQLSSIKNGQHFVK